MRAATATAPRYERAEEPDARNGMLEMFERAIELCKEQGLDAQMRTIVARTMPTAEPERTAGVNFALSMGTVLKALQDINPRNYSEGQRQTHALARQIVTRAMTAALTREAA